MKNKPSEIKALHFKPSENIPNNPKLPTLLYSSALEPSDEALADVFESLYAKHGWGGSWRWGVYDFHHYHSNAHEVLGVASGEATLKLGGPDGESIDVRAGDVVLLPAGTGHKNEKASADFQVVGAYPKGQENKDLIRNDQALDDAIRDRIAKVAIPKSDPVFGSDGPLLSRW